MQRIFDEKSESANSTKRMRTGSAVTSMSNYSSENRNRHGITVKPLKERYRLPPLAKKYKTNLHCDQEEFPNSD